MARSLTCFAWVCYFCTVASGEDSPSVAELADKLDRCHLIPVRECGHFKSHAFGSLVEREITSQTEAVFFTTDSECCLYYYAPDEVAGKQVGEVKYRAVLCQNPKYAFMLGRVGGSYALQTLDTKSRPKTATNAVIGGLHSWQDSNFVDLSYRFLYMTHLGRDCLSDLLRDPALELTCKALGGAEVEVTGRWSGLKAERPQPGGVVEDLRVVLRLSQDGQYAYIVEGAIQYSEPAERWAFTLRNKVAETPTHPRLLSSTMVQTDRSAAPNKRTIVEETYSPGPEFTKGHKPLFTLTDFDLPEPDPNLFVPSAAPAEVIQPPPGNNYLWLFILPPVGIFLVLLGRRLRTRRPVTPAES